MTHDSRWFPFGHDPVPGATKLFCLPFAGGGASFFLNWRRALTNVSVVPIQYPGRETRLHEQLPRDLIQLADEVAQALIPLIDKQYFLLGYSLGAKLAYAVCQRLRSLGAPQPALLIAAAHGAPDCLPLVGNAADLPEPEFRRLVRQYGGVPDIVFEDPELSNMLLPILRSDMRLAAQPLDGGLLNCPVVGYAGTEDSAALPHSVARWARHTQSEFHLRCFEGGHFFARTNPEFLKRLALDLQGNQFEADTAEYLPQQGHA
jgi:surfactin synthase thioesterase subunit